MQVDLDRPQPFPNKKSTKVQKFKKKNTWATAISTKKQNRVKTQKTKKYKNVQNVNNTKNIKMQNKSRQLLVLEYLLIFYLILISDK